ncbi:MAG: DUF1295 domain-containing protein [Candidatus Omnitrophica bacterium]|nr:DUF1295 domain-containing protein [Candidatus Omnitrophota bacterium]
MALREELEQLGNWFFRWRSYLPLLLVALFLIALRTVEYPLYPEFSDRTWELSCLVVSLFGLVIRMYAAACAPRGSSGRNVKEQRAYVLNTTGMYSITRHPLYLGNFLIWFGISLFVKSWWLVLATIFIFWFYYEKIMYAEEEFLRREYGDSFLNWANVTPVFFPLDFTKWRRPTLPFEFKNALRREYSGFFGVLSTFSVLKLFQDRWAHGEFVFDWVWSVIFVFGLVVYVALLILKKKTKVLDVQGR